MGDDAGAILLEGRRTRLVPTSRKFIDQMYYLASTNQIPWLWRGPETPRHFEEALWQDVLVQFAVQDVRTGEMVGLVRADKVNLHHGFAYLTLILFPEYQMRAWPLEAAVLFGNYVFRRYNLENLYAEAAEVHYANYRSGAGRFFEVQGQLRDRCVVDGVRQDLYILAFSRERSLAEAAIAIERIQRHRTLVGSR